MQSHNYISNLSTLVVVTIIDSYSTYVTFAAAVFTLEGSLLTFASIASMTKGDDWEEPAGSVFHEEEEDDDEDDKAD